MLEIICGYIVVVLACGVLLLPSLAFIEFCIIMFLDLSSEKLIELKGFLTKQLWIKMYIDDDGRRITQILIKYKNLDAALSEDDFTKDYEEVGRRLRLKGLRVNTFIEDINKDEFDSDKEKLQTLKKQVEENTKELENLNPILKFLTAGNTLIICATYLVVYLIVSGFAWSNDVSFMDSSLWYTNKAFTLGVWVSPVVMFVSGVAAVFYSIRYSCRGYTLASKALFSVKKHEESFHDKAVIGKYEVTLDDITHPLTDEEKKRSNTGPTEHNYDVDAPENWQDVTNNPAIG